MKKILIILIVLLLVGCDNKIDNVKEETNNNEVKQESMDPIKNTIDTIDTSKKNAVINSCNGIIRTIRYNSMLSGDSSGNVIDLNVEGVKAISGTWSIDNGNVILSKVVIDGYECNTVDNKIDCFKIN
ncbi:MAG: hypothetical protein J6B98_01870 [Bacilli bacterium]|nr:hypothetical protein [Bacilli bacterium]